MFNVECMYVWRKARQVTAGEASFLCVVPNPANSSEACVVLACGVEGAKVRSAQSRPMRKVGMEAIADASAETTVNFDRSRTV